MYEHPSFLYEMMSQAFLEIEDGNDGWFKSSRYGSVSLLIFFFHRVYVEVFRQFFFFHFIAVF